MRKGRQKSPHRGQISPAFYLSITQQTRVFANCDVKELILKANHNALSGFLAESIDVKELIPNLFTGAGLSMHAALASPHCFPWPGLFCPLVPASSRHAVRGSIYRCRAEHASCSVVPTATKYLFSMFFYCFSINIPIFAPATKSHAYEN